MIEHVFTLLCPFGGSAGGALGFLKANASILGRSGRFKLLGGIDVDPAACRNFRYLTGVEEWCADIRGMTAAQLRARYGEKAPDVVFLSAPCQGSSKLITDAKASEKHYVDLNELGVIWVRLMLEAWNPGPALVLFENVPHIVNRAKPMLKEIRKLLRGRYLHHDGFHDAGELGGLAQTRKRWLMVCRDPSRVGSLLYQPPKKRVRGCGEVLGPLPMPGDPAGGPMHRLPKISVMNWIRLAMIPAGGDWRDLPGVLVKGEKRREKFRRQHVAAWEAASPTVAGSGSNGPSAVADPRLGDPEPRGWDSNILGVRDWNRPTGTITGSAKVTSGGFSVADPRLPFGNVDNVTPWDAPIGTVTHSPAPSSGAAAVADPRIRPQADNAQMHFGKYRVREWEQPAATVIGATRIGSGAQSVADPRLRPPRVASTNFPSLGVVPWDAPADTITGQTLPANGRYSVSDPRLALRPARPDNVTFASLGVVPWTSPFSTVTTQCAPGNGPYSVADPRLHGAVGLLSLEEAGKLLVGPGPWAIVDPSSDGPPLMVITDLLKAPPFPLVIVAADGTWHRPLTTYELGILQSLPTHVDGVLLVLDGGSTEQRKQIGNLVPPRAAQAIAEQMLVTLLCAVAGSFVLSSGGGDVWVDRRGEALDG